MDKLIYKGVLCRLGTYRIMAEDKPALYYLSAPDWQTVYDAGFEEMHMAGPWVKMLLSAFHLHRNETRRTDRTQLG